MQTFKKLLFLLNTHEKKSAGLLLIMIIIMTLLDVIGVASILPFMAVLTNPNLIETNFILNAIYKEFRIFGIQNSQQFTFALGFLLFFILIISLIVKAIITYVQLQFVQLLEHSIGKRLVEAYLHQPYDWFLNRHSADLGKNILSEVGSVVGSGIGKLIELISKGAVTISIVILLIIVNSKLALMVGFSLIVAYVIIFYSVNTYLNRIGKNLKK